MYLLLYYMRFCSLSTVNKTYIWQGKPQKYRKDILEASHPDLKEASKFQLTNLEDFNNFMKLSWISRINKSNGKWTNFPNKFGLPQFTLTGENKTKEIAHNINYTFWKIIAEAMVKLLQCYHGENPSTFHSHSTHKARPQR